MSWGSRLMGKQRDYKNCWGPFGCINRNRFLWLLIFCSPVAAMLTWGLPLLGCVPPFSSASVAAPALFSFSVALSFLSLFPPSVSSPLFSYSMGEWSFSLSGRKLAEKWRALFCGNTEVIFLFCLRSYLVLPQKVATSLRHSLYHSLLISLLLVVLCVYELLCFQIHHTNTHINLGKCL